MGIPRALQQAGIHRIDTQSRGEIGERFVVAVERQVGCSAPMSSCRVAWVNLQSGGTIDDSTVVVAAPVQEHCALEKNFRRVRTQHYARGEIGERLVNSVQPPM